MTTWKDFQVFLRNLRNTQHLSQEGTAAILGCSRIHINRLENGNRRPSKLLLYAIKREFILDIKQMELVDRFVTMIEYKCPELPEM